MASWKLRRCDYALIAATLSYFFPPVTVLASTWLNTSGGSWNVPGNWNSLPNAIDAIADFSTLDITANATVTLDNSAGFTVGSMLFGDVTPSNDWTVNAGTPAGSIMLAVTTGSPTINVVNRTATIGAVLTGTQGFTKTGTGLLVLGGTNTFTGGIAINAGAVRLNNVAGAGGASGGTIVINTTGTLIGNGGTVATPINLAGGTLGSAVNGTTFSGAVTISADSTIRMADPLNLGTSSDVIITGILQGAGNISAVPVNNNTNPDAAQGLRFRGTTAGTYSGTITVSNNAKAELQTAVAGPFSPIGTGKIVLTGGTATLGGGDQSAPGTNGYSELNVRNNNGTAPGNTTFGNSLEVTGSGLVVLGEIGTAAAGATANMGNLKIGSGQTLGGYNSSGNAHTVAFSSVTLTGNATFSPRIPGFNTNNVTTAANIQLSNISEQTPGSSITMSGLATLFLAGNNTFTGGLAINSGIVQLGSTGALNSAAPNVVTFASTLPTTPGTAPTVVPIFRLNGNSVAVGGVIGTAYATPTPSGPFVENGNATPSTLTINASGNPAFGGVLQDGTGGGALSLVKSGIGTQTLTGNNTYTGSTAINGGTLLLSSAASGNNIPSSSGITVGGSGTLNVAGLAGGTGLTLVGTQKLTNNGAVTGNVIVPSGTFVNGTGTFANNLTAQNGSTFNVTINGATSDHLVVNGTANFTGSAITIALTTPATASFYDVLTAPGGLVGVPTLSTTNVGRTNFKLDPSPPSNTVRIDVTGGPANLRWTGADTNPAHDPTRWDNVQSDANWITSDAGVVDTTHFYDNDKVTFNDNDGGRYTVNVATAVSIGSMNVNNSAGDYVLGGSGAISGIGSLTKSGTRALTLSTLNTYSGGTILSQGTLNINSASAIGTGPLTINGGTIGNSSGADVALTTNNTQTWAADIVFAAANSLNLGTGAVTLNANPTVTVGANTTLTVGGIVSNGTGNAITKAGPGTLTLGGANTFSGGLTITNGTVRALAAWGNNPRRVVAG